MRQAVAGGVTVLVVVLAMLGVDRRATAADVTSAQRAEITQMKIDLRKAGNLFNQEKFQESADLVKDVQLRLGKLTEGAEADLLRQVDPVYKSLQKARALLEFRGIALPELPPLAAGEPAGDQVLFTKDVAPIIVGKCGNCHVTAARGMVSMTNYATLMKGPTEGVIVIPKDADGSRIIEVIEEGDMPRGGTKVTPEELETLKKWILAGATYDGDDPSAALPTLVPNARPQRTEPPQVTMASGTDSFRFSRDIAPILVENCVGCHGGGQQAASGFNLTTFTGLLRGGDGGPPILPKDGAESLLIKKLKGTAGGDRMPRNRPPLSDEVIARFEKWIDEGAPFDGPNAGQSIAELAARAKAESQTHQELSADRAVLAATNWQLGLPGVFSDQHETENFLILGNVGKSKLTELGELSESLADKIQTILKVPRQGPFIKGRMSLFVVGKRYDYAELGKMVERRDVPYDEMGHFRFTIIDAYGTLLLPGSEEFSLEALLGEQIGGAYVASFGMSPDWFREGAARVLASRIQRDDARVTAWNEALPSVLAQMKKADDFLKGQLPAAETAVANYHFVGFLMSDARRFQKVLGGLEQGQAFAEAFTAAYGGTPEQAAELWVRRAASRR